MPEVKNLDILYTSIFGGFMPIPQHMKADGTMVATGEANPMPIMTLGMLPIQFQETLRTQDTIQTLAPTVVTANNWKQGDWIDVQGYETLVATSVNDAASSNSLEIAFSHDKVTTVSNTIVTVTTATNENTLPVKAKYARVSIKNGDTANPHTMSTFLYRKS